MVIFARESFSFVSKPKVFLFQSLPAKETSDIILSTFLGYPRARRRVLKLVRDSWKFFPEEFVRRSLIIASPLIKPLLTPGG